MTEDAKLWNALFSLYQELEQKREPEVSEAMAAGYRMGRRSAALAVERRLVTLLEEECE